MQQLRKQTLNTERSFCPPTTLAVL